MGMPIRCIRVERMNKLVFGRIVRQGRANRAVMGEFVTQ